MMNLWYSDHTGNTYEMPVDWIPQYDGWQLVGTVEKISDKDEKTLDR